MLEDHVYDGQLNSSGHPSKLRLTATTRKLIFLALVALSLIAAFLIADSLNQDGSGSSKPWQALRLPTNVKPTRYTLWILPDLNEFTFRGTVTIDIDVTAPTSTILAHAVDLEIHSVELTDAAGTARVLDHSFHHPENQFFVTQWRRRLGVGQYKLRFEFSGHINDEPRGFYRSSYTDKDGNTRWVAATQFQSTNIRRALPAFDEPGFKAVFDISLTVPQAMVAHSNMPVASSAADPDAPGHKRVTFEPTPRMSTYLVAFAVTDYVSVADTTKSGVEIRVWTDAGKIDQTELALQAGATILDFFEEILDIPYPLPKLDMMAFADFAADTMENWGLAVYHDAALLWKDEDGSGSAAAEDRCVKAIARQLSHHFFGNQVSPSWWRGLFINEGYAAYYGYEGTHRARPQWAALEQFVGETQLQAMQLDSNPHSHPMAQEVTGAHQIEELFDAITSGKDASMVRMLNGMVGPAVFLKGVKLYLEEFKLGSAEVEDFWRNLQKAANEAGLSVDVNRVMRGWTHQVNYPLIRVATAAAGNKVTLTQERFVVGLTEEEEDLTAVGASESTFKWDVFVRYVTGGAGATPKSAWLMATQPSLTLDYDPAAEAWIKLDHDETGFFRVLYEPAQWNGLEAALAASSVASVLTANDRQGLLDDAFALAEAGLLEASQALNLTRFLAHEDAYPVWLVGLRRLNDWGGRLVLESGSYHLWRRHLRSLVQERLAALGWGSLAHNDSHSDQLLRPLLLEAAVDHGLGSWRQEALQRFQAFQEAGGEAPVDSNLAEVIYKVGVAEGGEPAFWFMYNRYLAKSSTDVTEARRCLVAMSRTREPWLLQVLLDAALGRGPAPEPIRNQDTIAAILHVSSGSVLGQQMAWKHVQRHWGRLFQRYGLQPTGFGSLVRGVLAKFDTPELLAQASAFLQQQREANKLGTASRAADQALAAIRANIHWKERNVETIQRWLEAEVGSL